MNDRTLTAFTAAYIEALFFTDTGDQDQPPADSILSPEAKEAIREDCNAFLDKHSGLILQTPHSFEKAAHDFWFTRNGHGVGFWDGDWPEPQATQLTDAAQAFGQCDTYQGDDGLIYLA